MPEQGRNRLGSMVASRPDWCISRQRAWGVPIAVFVDKRTGEPLRDPAVVARIVEAFKAEGADSWYSSPPSRFLGNDRNPDDYEQVMDIVDVWFEAGSTHAFVLEARGLPWPADLYLEGSDQHRGWFQSSLLEAVGTRGVAPFKAVLTDGFVMDEQGRKMSKSLGNVTAPQEVADKFGVDILRLWVMMSDTSEDLRIGPEILKQQVELYRRLRNTLRWLLGSLAGFTEAERVPYADMPELEKWVLHRLTELDARIRAAVQSYDWTGVYPELHNFCATDLSAFYFDVRKDAIYCDRPDSLRRRAARTVLDHLHRCLTTWLAPVLCFTAEEAWCARFGEQDSVHLQLFPTLPAEWRDDALAARWETIRAIRRRITVPIEEARRANALGSSLQASVTLPLNAEQRVAADSAEQWAEIAIVSNVRIERGHGRCRWRRSARRPAASARAAGACCRRWGGSPGIRRCANAAPTRWSRDWSAARDGTPSPNPLPQGEGETAGFPSPCGRGLGEGASHDPQPPHPARPRRRRRRAGRRPGQQVVDPRRRPSAGGRPDRPAPGPEPHHGLEPRRHLRPADRLRPVELPRCSRPSRSPWSPPSASGCAAPNRRLVATALGAIVGGALSNVIDRLRFGAVVDFIHAHIGAWSWYVFNLADAAIVCGVAALVLDSLLPRARRAPDVHRMSVLATRRDLRLENRVDAAIDQTLHDRPRAGRLRRGTGRLQRRRPARPQPRPDPRRAGRVHRDHARAARHAAQLRAAAADARARSRPQEQSERAKAELALVPQMALGGPAGGSSPGQQALVQAAGPPAAPGDPHRGGSGGHERPALAGYRRQADVLAQAAAAGDRGRSARRRRSACARTPPSARARRPATRRSSSPRSGPCWRGSSSDRRRTRPPRISSRSAPHQHSAAPAPATCCAAAARRC